MEIITAGIIVAAVLTPLVHLFDKWKKEMVAEEQQEK